MRNFEKRFTLTISGDTLSHFIAHPNKVFIEPPARKYKPVSVDGCASKCLSQVTFDCEGYTFCHVNGMCALLDGIPDLSTGSTKSSHACSVYTSKFQE